MNPKNVLSLRWRTPRTLALAGLMALVIVVTALALAQTSTVAAPPPPLRGPFRFVEFPSWKRDGSQIYFSAIEQDRNDADIYSIDLATRQVTARISTPAADVCPHFTHDGKFLTYASIDPAEGYEGNVDVFRHDLASDDTSGTADQRLTDAEGHDDYANPSPDDKQYVFISNREGNFDLYLMDADGSHQRRLASTPDARENVPDW